MTAPVVRAGEGPPAHVAVPAQPLGAHPAFDALMAGVIERQQREASERKRKEPA